VAFRTEDILDLVRDRLQERGIDLDEICGGTAAEALKIVCLAPGLKESVREMGEATRDRVVMVRIDEATSRALDDWVETGAVKSRSEGAALFMREGLKVRSDELDQLKEALRDVEDARERLKRKAREVLGGEEPGAESGGAAT